MAAALLSIAREIYAQTMALEPPEPPTSYVDEAIEALRADPADKEQAHSGN